MPMSRARTGADRIHVLLAGAVPPNLRRAFRRYGHHAECTPLDGAVAAVSAQVEGVLLSGSRAETLGVGTRLKTRYQVPLLPVVALVTRPSWLKQQAALPDAWLSSSTPPRDVVARLEELVRIRRAELELVRLNGALADLAAENGRLYDRARRDAEATTLLLRELQHRVRNNLAAIQALLVLERHRQPARPLVDALDVAISRLRTMAALQDSLQPHENKVQLAALADAVTRAALDVFGATGTVHHEIRGDATLSARAASALAIVLNELVTNSLKHAGAQLVTLEIGSAGGQLELIVADDGRGTRGDAAGGSGLMIARAVVRNELSGVLSFLPSERGTRVRVSLPVKSAEQGGVRSTS